MAAARCMNTFTFTFTSPASLLLTNFSTKNCELFYDIGLEFPATLKSTVTLEELFRHTFKPQYIEMKCEAVGCTGNKSRRQTFIHK